MVAGAPASLAEVTERVGQIADPEIPVVTLADLGILRQVELVDDQIKVTLTPTYSGCPATEAIASDVREVLDSLGHRDAQIDIALNPPWSTDWMRAGTHEKLRAYGIAPPGRCRPAGEQTVRFMSVPGQDGPVCPRCASPRVEVLSEFGSTPCKALYRCLSCAEPFDYFKPF